MDVEHPPRRLNAMGETRRVGLEIEFAGLPCDRSALLVQEVFGGTVNPVDEWYYRVEGTGLGDFTIELDTQYAHPPEGAETDPRRDTEMGQVLSEALRNAVGHVGKLVVPMEIVTPPMPYPEMHQLIELGEKLRAAGGRGTRESFAYAFGLHINPEVPTFDEDHVTDILKAYLLLSEWLRHHIEIDLARRVLPFVDPFPKHYAMDVVDPGYRPGLPGFIDDYLRDNPTRNRELDMLPLFAHLDEQRVRSQIDDPRINARPAYHYRLPDSRLDDPGKSVVHEWNRWLTVERLAEDRDKLEKMGRAYQRSMGRPRVLWIQSVEEFLKA